MLALEPRGHRRKVRARGLHRHAGAKASDEAEVVAVSIVETEAAGGGDEDLGARVEVVKGEARGHDADDRERRAVESDGGADGAGIPAEAPSPEVRCDDGERVLSRGVFA